MNSSISPSDKRRRAWRFAFWLLLSLLVFDRLFFWLFLRAEAVVFRTASLEQKLRNLPDKPAYEILVFGTSRTYDAVHPRYLRDRLGRTAYKEAFQGKGPYYNYLFYKLYRRCVGVPRMVVYGVDYFLFNIESEPRLLQRFQAMPKPRLELFGKPSYLWSHKPRIDRFWISLLEQWRLGVAGRHIFNPEENIEDMAGFLGEVGPVKLVTRRPPQPKTIPFFPYPGLEGEYFTRLLDELQRDGVAVVLLGLPDYIGTRETNVEYPQFCKYMRRTARAHARCVFLDYNTPELFPLERTEFFLNGGYGETNSHISLTGAEVFNRRFTADLADVAARLGLPWTYIPGAN